MKNCIIGKLHTFSPKSWSYASFPVEVWENTSRDSSVIVDKLAYDQDLFILLDLDAHAKLSDDGGWAKILTKNGVVGWIGLGMGMLQRMQP